MFRNAIITGLVVSMAAALFAQAQPGGTLAGKLTDPSGAAVANATVTATNIDSGQTRTATTGADGGYQLTMLPPGSYRVKFEAAGFKPLEIASATVGAAQGTAKGTAPTVVDGKLEPGASTPSLGDLGFTPDQSQGSAQDQARLDKRSHMLKIHQRLGLITTAPLVATLFLANGAAGHNSTASKRDLHAILGGTTAAMYITTASFAIFAPKIAGTQARGPVRVHRALAWIHGPGMILTPILGSLALAQRDRGEKVHGIASAHGAVAGVTAAAYGVAMLSVMIKF